MFNNKDNKNNTGIDNTGDSNTGDGNTGDGNTGDRNTGDWNTGYRNTGYRNTGDRNTGDRNTGDWNQTDYSTGFFNTTEEPFRMFNKEVVGISRDDISFPYFFYFDLTEWIYESDMTDEEKEKNPTYKTTDGYLKEYGYKEAFQKSYKETDEDDRKKVFALPNFDADIFYKISGIDVRKSDKTETINIGGIEYDKNEVEEKLKGIKPIKESK